MASLSSAQRKFARGIEQVKSLCGEAETFEHDDAYTFEKEVESRTAQQIKYRCFAVERKTMPDDWPLRAGEAVQNLRASLDHFIYQASGRRSRSQFPIFTDPCEFQVLAGRMLDGVSPTVRASVERSQPYIRVPQAPAQDAMEQLRTLSNADKHRTLATVVSAVQMESVGIPDGVDIHWEKYGTNTILGTGKTHISTFVASFEREPEEMHVEPRFAYQVRIERRPFSHLTWIAREVFRTLAECETGKKLSPFAPYPL